VLHCIAAAAADADDLDDRAVFRRFVDDFKHGAFLSPVWISGIGDQVSGISGRSQWMHDKRTPFGCLLDARFAIPRFHALIYAVRIYYSLMPDA
jgi:hypothetical protein